MEDNKQLFMLLEIPKGEKNKYEYEPKAKTLILKRIGLLSFPINYGSLFAWKEEENTLNEDGDELDVICLGEKTVPNCLVPIRVIGVLKMTDSKERDDKIVAVNAADEECEKIQDLSDVDEKTLKKINFFFSHYKDWNNPKEKKIIIEGWGNKKDAYQIINSCKNLYQKYKKMLAEGMSEEEAKEKIKKNK